MGTRKTVVDWGFNVIPFDPSQRVRNFWGAVFTMVLLACATGAGVWFGFKKWMAHQIGFMAVFQHFPEAVKSVPWVALVLALSLMLAVAAGVWGFVLAFKPVERCRHVRGRRYLDEAEALKKAQQITAEECGATGESTALNGFTLSNDRATKHALISGAVGSGKTVICHHFLKSIFSKREKALIVDWKGDFTAAYKKALLFSPFDARSVRYCVAEDCTTELDATTLADSLIPDNKKGDAFFVNASRSVLIALIVKLQQEKPQAWTWGDLYAEASNNIEQIQSIVQKYYPHAFANIADAQSKQTQGVMSSMLSNFNSVRVLAQAEADNPSAKGFSIRRWLADKTRPQIILAGNTEHENLSKAYINSILNAAGGQIQALKDDNQRKIWVVVDELPKLGKCEAIPKLLAFARSKGCRVVGIVQDFSQLKEAYGQNETKAMLSMVGTLFIGQTAGSETADTICQQIIGKREIERRNITDQGGGKSSSSWSRDEILVVHPSELQTELGPKKLNNAKKFTHINALVLGLGEYALNLPFSFVAPTPAREPFVWREVFQSKKLEIQAIQLPEPPEQENKQAEHERGDIPTPAIQNALPMLGHAFEIAEMVDLLKSKPVISAPVHTRQNLKAMEEEQEKEE